MDATCSCDDLDVDSVTGDWITLSQAKTDLAWAPNHPSSLPFVQSIGIQDHDTGTNDGTPASGIAFRHGPLMLPNPFLSFGFVPRGVGVSSCVGIVRHQIASGCCLR